MALIPSCLHAFMLYALFMRINSYALNPRATSRVFGHWGSGALGPDSGPGSFPPCIPFSFYLYGYSYELLDDRIVQKKRTKKKPLTKTGTFHLFTGGGNFYSLSPTSTEYGVRGGSLRHKPAVTIRLRGGRGGGSK